MKPVVFSQVGVDEIHLVEQTCPKCQQVLWSRPNAAFICVRCYNKTHRLVLLNPIDKEAPFDEGLIHWTNEELAKLDMISGQVPPIKDPTSSKRSGHRAAKAKV